MIWPLAESTKKRTWNIGRVEMINENVDATTNKQDITATTWKYKKIEVIWLLF